MMKRSKKVLIPRLRKNTLLGAKSLSVAIASVVAASCSFKEEAHIFKSVSECDASPKFSQAECQAAYQKALVAAENTAPRYKTKRDCEYEFGPERCEQHSASSNSRSYFMPLMAGFMISEAFRRNSYHGYNPIFSYYGNGYSSYREPVWTTSDGSKVGAGSKRSVNVSKSTLKPKLKPSVTRTLSRGGFGSTVSAKSSWGGGSKGGWGG